MLESICYLVIACLACALLGGCTVALGREAEPGSGEMTIIESNTQTIGTPVATIDPSGVESEPASTETSSAESDPVSTDTSLLETDLPEPDPTDSPARPVMQYDCTKWSPVPGTVRNGRMVEVCDGWAPVGGQ
jgi:hypothetical protein